MEVMKRLLSVLAVFCVGFNLTSADFKEDGLLLHNQLRAKHGAGPLVLNEALNAYAQNWAQHMANTDNSTHSDGPYGENLYYKRTSKKFSDSDAVKRGINNWYEEISDYNFSSPGRLKGTGHFTALVWKNSKYLGIGVARNGDKIYVCANYDPKGNIKERFAENVAAANQ